ncbi:LacI family DNA-binding transcriptional regulator [Flagellimonas pacifica]|uniref:Transcriptional regulator, LacI family n=1 Tax=Flagellimonas pacifica TaxID=1247520 RepID=A0A285MV77_9FLAO|nr:LacI family DNA-binding transcriptional regulator [Allomuricauda parva]SNZ00437.1 transcriptional regulator, LacI family [Allomuricauda parva]
MTTLKELASILDLAPSTISKSLNNSPEISDCTKLKVKEAAKEFGYIPNNAARSLKLKRTKCIGVIIPNVTDAFFGKVLHGIEEEARKHNYTIMVSFSNNSHRLENNHLQNFMNFCVDGVLISFSTETQRQKNYKHLNNLESSQMPLVMFDRVLENSVFSSVTIDDLEGAYNATTHLIKTGCKKIAFVSPIAETSVGKNRKHGYLDALQSHGYSSQPICIEFNSYDDFKPMLKEAMKSNDIDAFIAADELSAICTLNTVQQWGYQVPNQISIVGFTNGVMGQCSNPPLTMVSQNAEKMGKETVKSFIKAMEKPNLVRIQHKVIKTELVLRDSTRPLL